MLNYIISYINPFNSLSVLWTSQEGNDAEDAVVRYVESQFDEGRGMWGDSYPLAHGQHQFLATPSREDNAQTSLFGITLVTIEIVVPSKPIVRVV